MDQATIEQRIRDGERTSQGEALGALGELLRGAEDAPAEERSDRLREAAVTAYSLVTGVDQSQGSTEDVLAELRSDGKRAPELCELLRRLIDRAADDAIDSPAEALAELEATEPAVRADEERRRADEERRLMESPPAKPAGTTIVEERAARSRRTWAKVGCGVLVLALVGLLATKVLRENEERFDPSYDALVEGTVHSTWDDATLAERRMDPTWAREVFRASTREDLAQGALMWPDEYDLDQPDDGRVWRAKWDDEGLEWLALCFGQVRANRIVVVETRNPGALVAIDDMVDGRSPGLGAGRHERLWQGELEVTEGHRTDVFELAEPRYIRCLRLVLDTSRAPGRNGIDAVGLLLE